MNYNSLTETLNYPTRDAIWTLKEPLREFILILEAQIENLKRDDKMQDESKEEKKDQTQMQVRSDGDLTPGKSGLLCPSGRKLKAVEILSVIAYYHVEDNTSCTHMNEFETSVETILLEYMNTMIEFKQNPALSSILATSPKARNVIYKKLSKVGGRELANLLKAVILSFENTSISSTLITELIETFGQTVVHNIKNVVGDDYTKFYKHKRSFSPMVMLGIDDLDDINDLIEKKKKDMPQTLNDIFVKKN